MKPVFALLILASSTCFAAHPAVTINEQSALNFLITNVNQTRVWFYSDIPESDTVATRLAAALGVMKNKIITHRCEDFGSPVVLCRLFACYDGGEGLDTIESINYELDTEIINGAKVIKGFHTPDVRIDRGGGTCRR